MRKNKQLLVVVVLMFVAVVAFFNQQRTERHIERLRAEGFRTDQRLESDPLLLIDKDQRQLAVIYPDHALRFGFQQVTKIETRLDVNHKDQEERLLQLDLRDHPQSNVVLEGATPEQVLKWQQLLRSLISNAP